MSQIPENIQRQYDELTLIATNTTLPEIVRRSAEDSLEKLQEQYPDLAHPSATTPTNRSTNTKSLEITNSSHKGVIANMISQSTINQFFGAQPPDDGKQLLQNYLHKLIEKYKYLRLDRMIEKRQSGAEQATTPKMKLQHVYASLTTNGPPIATGKRRTRTHTHVHKLMQRMQDKLDERTPATCDPLHVRHLACQHPDGSMAELQVIFSPPKVPPPPIVPPRKPPSGPRLRPPTPVMRQASDADEQLMIQFTRPELALDAIRQHQRLVLLGEPGSGKSTVLRYLAVLLAQKLLSMPTAISGWEKVEPLPVPILCPLGEVARTLTKTDDADQALWQTLEQNLDGVHRLRDGLLKDAMKRGAVLLLCDGLDELPQTSTSDTRIKPRRDIARAIGRLAMEIPDLRVVLTSRVKPYHAASDWQMSHEDDWETRTIQPLAFGQVQTFIHSWYQALLDEAELLSEEEATSRSNHVISQIEAHAQLHPLMTSPLLLTMLVTLHYNKDTIPDDRVELYDECIELLLDRWEPIRSSTYPDEQRKLLARLGHIHGLTLKQLRNVVHELAFEAHDQPPADDGRGLITGEKLDAKLFRLFANLRCTDVVEKVQIFREVLETDAGLLQVPDHDRYTFPHLTFQEYLAACHIVDQVVLDYKKRTTLAYQRWCSADAERWREVLLLMMGRLRYKGGSEVLGAGVPWLKLLVGAKTRSGVKAPLQRQRDLVLAALSYTEIGGRSAFASWELDVEDELEAPLRNGLVELLADPDPQIGMDDRVAVATTLGQIGDLRFPVTETDWAHETETLSTTFGKPKGYWCYIPAGTYRIGGWAENEPAADITLPEYWMARFPITVAQFRPFVEVGYSNEGQRWWTPQGWQWKERSERTVPWGWGSATWGGPNQPVIGVNWYEGIAFVNWLNEQLSDTLPADYQVRLPTEAEWEVAAAYAGNDQRRTYPWGEAAPTWEHAVYNTSELQQTAPVGCCAKGQAACGALDLAGNVWEWAASDYGSYPQESHRGVEELNAQRPMAPMRGGSWRDQEEQMFCGARFLDLPVNLLHLNLGLRVVVSLR